MTHKLMIKTHNKTGLKYLCYTKSDGPAYEKYKGSGKRWKRHLKKYGDDITTELIYETNNYDDFKKIAIEKSYEYNIVESNAWANLKIEEGDGGDTVSNRMWITDGTVDKYVYKDSVIPEGWNKGRSNCIFNDSDKQKEFSSRADLSLRGQSIKNAWDSGKFDKRDHSKCGTKGDNNPAKRAEVRKKISDSALKESDKRSQQAKTNLNKISRCPHCHKVARLANLHRWHLDKCKHKI